MITLAAMSKYDSYKETGVQWLGKIPASWNILRFKYCFNESNAGEVIDKSFWNVGEEILYTCKREPMKSNYLGFNENRRTKESDLLLTRNGTPYVHLPVENSIYSNVVQKVALKNNIHREFIWYALGNSAKYLAGYGDIIESFNMSTWDNLITPMPTYDEQKEIAEFLNCGISKIDNVIALKEKQIALLKERKQILIQNAVTRGLDPNVPMKDSGVEWIGEIPEHWAVRRSKFLFTQRTERARPEDVQLSATQSYGVIPQNEYEQMIGRKVVKIQFHLDKRKHVELDDFVISMRSFQGGLERAWASGCIRSSYVVLRPLEKIDADFYAYLLKSKRYIEALQSTGNFIRDGQDLNFDNFSLVDLFIPPLDEQRGIAAHIDRQTTLMNRVIREHGKQIEKLKEYKSTLINSAVTGKIKVA